MVKRAGFPNAFKPLPKNKEGDYMSIFIGDRLIARGGGAKDDAAIMSHLADNGVHVPHLGTTTNSGNSYSITSTKVINDGAKFSVKFNTAATGTATLKISSDGTARTLKKPDGNNFKPKAGVYSFIRDGENFQLLGEGGEYGTAEAQHVLEGYTVGTEDGLIEGTVPIIGPDIAETVNLTSEGEEYTILQGFHSGLRKIKAAIANLIASVIKKGAVVGGVTGTYTHTTKPSTVDDVLSGKEFFVNGSEALVGTMANKTGGYEASAISKSSNQLRFTVDSAGYFSSGAYLYYTDNDWIEANIKSGKEIFGKTGTCVEATGNASPSEVLSDKTFSKSGSSGLTGTMPNRGSKTFTPSDSTQTGSSGYYSGITVNPRPSLDGTAATSNVLSGKTFYGSSYTKQTGTMPNRGSQTTTLNITGASKPTKSISSGYVSTSTITAQVDSGQASHIEEGYNLGGCVGTLVVPVPYLAEWTQRTSSFDTTSIRRVAYGNGMFIATGYAGKLATSSDGITWTQRTSSFGTTNLSGAAYGNGMFVAVGASGKLATSSDGITWTKRTSSFGTTNVNDVAYGNGMFVAVGSSGKLATSPDGVTWTQRTSSFSSSHINAIAYGNGMFVVVGSDGKLATSSNGITWTQRTSSFGSSYIYAAAYGNGMFVAVGQNGKLATSSDGITWTQRISSFDDTGINAAAYGSGMFVAVGYDGKLAASSDGITWTQKISGFSDSYINAVAYGNGMFVAAGQSAKLATLS